MKPFRYLSLPLVVLFAPLHGSQIAIPLTPDDFNRLGIAFAPVKSGAEGAGARFPATVIASPDGVSTLTVPYPGVIEKWLVAPGDPVRAGQPLVVIRSQEALRLQQEWMAAVAATAAARLELEKTESLQREGIVAQQRVILARQAHEQSAFTQRAAEEALRRIGFGAEQLDAMRRKDEGLGIYHLVAHAGGIVTRRTGATGDFAEGNTTLIRLRADGPNWVSLQVPARMVAGLHVGQTLRVRPSGEELVLRQKEHGVEDRSQTVGLLAEFKAETAHLPGQIVTVELPPPDTGALVPGSAVVHSGNETSVFVRSATGVEAREVTLQPIGSDYVALAGLKNGEEVVVRGAAVLKGIQAGFGRIE